MSAQLHDVDVDVDDDDDGGGGGGKAGCVFRDVAVALALDAAANGGM